MSRPALLDKLLQAGKWLFKPDLIPVDGTTLKRGAADISVAIDALARSGGGLAVDAKTGKLYVDFSLVPDDQMQAIVLAMVQQGGGLAVDGAGKLFVDFGSMPTDKFEAMLKSIRVPVWLTKNLTIYVVTTGSDMLDEGRRLTPGKPFATLQAALNHVSTTYNLYLYVVTIRVAAGDYGRKTISLPAYQTTSGYIRIIGEERDSTRVGRISNRQGSHYYIYSMMVDPVDATDGQIGCYSSNGTLSLFDVGVDLTDTQHGDGTNLIPVCVEGRGDIRIPASDIYMKRVCSSAWQQIILRHIFYMHRREASWSMATSRLRAVLWLDLFPTLRGAEAWLS